MATFEEFDRGAVTNAGFHHEDHVRIAFELLVRDEFDVALARFTGRLRAMAAASGHAEKFHMTVTVAFMAAIGERLAQHGTVPWEEFARRNRDLLDRAFVRGLYSAAQLESEVARRTFVLPRRRGTPCAV